MSEPLTGLLDPTRILFDLQRGNEIAQRFSGCLEPEEIARQLTDGLVETFGCAFARLWLLEADQSALRLVASSGMYTNTDGFFSRVPMGAYKVGKIAQNRVSFLSNDLPAEPWVGNREWAIANGIRGFAGYPLTTQDRVIGVLATFSRTPLAPEFLEILQTLCTIAAISLNTALHYQQEKQCWPASPRVAFSALSLSDQLAGVLHSARLTLVGTEQPLPVPLAYLFLHTASILHSIQCTYCRLIYKESMVCLEAIVPTYTLTEQSPESWIKAIFRDMWLTVAALSGELQIQASGDRQAVQVILKLPYWLAEPIGFVEIQCRAIALQFAFTQLANLASLQVCYGSSNAEIPLITDDEAYLTRDRRILWVHQKHQSLPKGIKVKVDLFTTPEELQEAYLALKANKSWGIETRSNEPQVLSDRELEILTLLTQGLRDRDIADRLIISESTVKFHMNNVLNKLKARTRYQAIHLALVNGWI